MRVAVSGLVVLGAAALLAGCSKGGSSSQEPVMPATPSLSSESAAPPASETPAQKAIVATLPAPYDTGDPVAGEAKFSQCRSCHSIAKGAPNLTGPNLWGAYGHKAAQVPGFEFSDALKAANLTLDAPTLDKWITNPQAMVQGTKMTFAGLPNPQDRYDIIAFLATQKDQ